MSKRPTTSPSSTSRSPGAARTNLAAHRAPGHDRRACREAHRHGARALHPRHAAHPLRRGRLERLAAARRPEHARLDGEQLDGRAALPAAPPLRRGAAPGRPRGRGASTRGARRRDARDDFNRHLIRDGTVAGYAIFEPGRDRAGAPAPSERHAHRPQLLAPADEARHHRRAVHAGAGRASSRAHPRASALSRRRAADGQAGRLSRRAGADLPPRRVGRHSSGARSASCMCTRICAMARRWRRWARPKRCGMRCSRSIRSPSPSVLGQCVARASATPISAAATPAFPTAMQASAEWERVKTGEIAVDGGWRIYSSGPGLYANMLIRHALGRRRHFGERIAAPLLPSAVGKVSVRIPEPRS